MTAPVIVRVDAGAGPECGEQGSSKSGLPSLARATSVRACEVLLICAQPRAFPARAPPLRNGSMPFADTGFTVSFYVPDEYQAAPPEPTSELVTITDLPALKVYVRSFGGWAVGECVRITPIGACPMWRGVSAVL